MSDNTNLNKAKASKKDTFLTQLPDIEKELKYYKKTFKDKIIFCNTDNNNSNFVKYFSKNFRNLKLKELINSPIDFRSNESIKFLKKADIICTNPPFSLWREYIKQLEDYNKKYLIIGSLSAITYKEVFPLIRDNKLWIGVTNPKLFEVPMDYDNKIYKIENNKKYVKLGNTVWYTNLPHSNQNKELILTKKYNAEKYPTFDNYPAINCDRVKDIPIDYYGNIGVPISFIEKYNPNQFEIIKFRKGNGEKDLRVNGKDKYCRIIIKKKITTNDFEIIDLKKTPKIGNKNIFNRIIIKRK